MIQLFYIDGTYVNDISDIWKKGLENIRIWLEANKLTINQRQYL